MKRFFIIVNNVISIFFKLNIVKTLYFNFKVFPFKTAIKLPVHFYGKVNLVNLTGNFVINVSKVKFGMIVFGGKHEVVISSNTPTRIYNSGTIEFKDSAIFGRGVNLMVWDKGELFIGSNFSIGSLSRIICFRKIYFMDNVLISWETQLFDTDFHFIESEDSIRDNCGEVSVHDNVWIGARATVLKNTILPKNTIVAAQSLCSGNYLEKYGEGVLLAGLPAKKLRENVKYLSDKKKEMHLFDYFSTHQNSEIKL